jgi:hypothetical protein
MSHIYQFHVEGHLDQTWSAWLGDVLVQQQHDGTTLLTQTIPDQSALYGVLFKLNNIGLSLIAVQRISKSAGADHNDP